MNRSWGLLPVVLLFCLSSGGAAAASEVKKESGGAGHAHHTHHRPSTVRLEVPGSATAMLWKPNLEQQALEVKEGSVAFPRTGMGDYHAIIAEWEDESVKEARIRYHYLRGRPSGHSPRELLKEPKTTLEIVPAPLPREHFRYQTTDRWGFLVRFGGTPLPGTKVRLETVHGSRLEAQTDAQGRVEFALPDDFPAVKPGRRATPPARFTLSVGHAGEGGRFRTLLLADYHPGPHHWQSTGWGLGVMALGLVAGLAVSRVGNGKKGGKGE